LADDERALVALKRLRDLGCRVSIDDLGAGLSSLGCLRRLQVDEVKIDLSFVSEIESSSSGQDVLRTIMGLADCLGLSVVVDGVETLRQGAAAESMGAKRMQGPAYGKPRPALEWLADKTYRGTVKPSKSERTALLPVG
jgi:EAL domain-containing protein (putative c-di-GMP-specific phosphodiesterase class I)